MRPEGTARERELINRIQNLRKQSFEGDKGTHPSPENCNLKSYMRCRQFRAGFTHAGAFNLTKILYREGNQHGQVYRAPAYNSDNYNDQKTSYTEELQTVSLSCRSSEQAIRDYDLPASAVDYQSNDG